MLVDAIVMNLKITGLAKLVKFSFESNVLSPWSWSRTAVLKYGVNYPDIGVQELHKSVLY